MTRHEAALGVGLCSIDQLEHRSWILARATPPVSFRARIIKHFLPESICVETIGGEEDWGRRRLTGRDKEGG